MSFMVADDVDGDKMERLTTEVKLNWKKWMGDVTPHRGFELSVKDYWS